MARTTVLVLGGGWGGLALAHDLRTLLPPEHRVVVVERNEAFSLCTSYLWLMTGERERAQDVQRPMSKLARPGIEWVHDEVERIDPDARAVTTSSGILEGDYLVIALGARSALGDLPGLAGAAHNLYDARGAAGIHTALSGFPGGRVVVLVAGTPFRCPAAPYEAAMLVEWLFRARGMRDRIEIAMYTPEKQPMPVAGPAVGDALRAMLGERGIAYHPEHTVSSVDADAGLLSFEGEEVPFDLLIAVPPHRAPRTVVEAGLTDDTGYIPVHPQSMRLLADPLSLEPGHPGVFAIGDVTSIRLMNGMLLPKAGVFVEAQARVVAEEIAAEVRGDEPLGRFDGTGFCYIEVGEGMAAYGAGDFYSYPGPSVRLEPPSVEHRRAKLEFERMLDAWFVS